MIVGVLRFTLRIPEVGSLKDRRRAVKSLVERARRRYNVAVAEVGDGEAWTRAELAVACVSGSARHADQVLQEVLRWLERETAGQIEDVELELR